MESPQNNAFSTFNSTELVIVDHGEMPAESDAVIAILTGVSVGLVLFFTCLCCAIYKYKTFVYDTKFRHHHELQMKDSIEQSQRLSLRSAASSSNANNQDVEALDTSLAGVTIER